MSKPIKFVLDEFKAETLNALFGETFEDSPQYTYEQRYEHALTMLRRGGVTIPEPSEILPDIEAAARLIAEGRLSFLPLGYRELEDAFESEPDIADNDNEPLPAT